MTMKAIGEKRWAIAEGHIPAHSNGPQPQMLSHEIACLLNTSDSDANVRITIFSSARQPVGPSPVVVPARPTKHLRFNNLKNPAPIPVGVDSASLIESDTPIIVQRTRAASRQSENALLTTIAYGSD